MGFDSINTAVDPRLNLLSSPERNNRKTWSAPNENGQPINFARGKRGPGPGEGPNYVRGRMTQQQQIPNSFDDPLQHLHSRSRNAGQYQQSEYSPSVYDVNGSRVNARKIGTQQTVIILFQINYNKISSWYEIFLRNFILMFYRSRQRGPKYLSERLRGSDCRAKG